MTDQTPTPPNSLPPLGSTPSTPPSGSTPPPPPPPPRPPAAAPEPGDSEPEPSQKSARPRTPLLVALVAVLAVGLVGLLVVVMGGDSDDGEAESVDAADTPVETVASTVAPATTAAPETTAAPATTEAPTTTVAPSTTQAPTTTAAPTTTEAPVTTPAGPSYPTLPDGSPEPIVAIFNGPVVQVSGWVPSEEKGAQLIALALANSTDPNAQVDADLQIDPAVPLNIGTRVIEVNSPRFPAGSSDVTPEHAAQLDRVASVMSLLTNVTVTVVGHADQIGDAASNYALSEARAVSVVRYLVGQGIEPSRLSARAVGEEDLLFEEDSPEALALNRRTEFIFYGLIAD